MTSKRTAIIGQPATRRRTIGAIDGYFPSARQRRLNRQLADMSVGAQMGRDADAADTRAHSTMTYLGRCQNPDCGQHEYGAPNPAAACRRCGAAVK